MNSNVKSIFGTDPFTFERFEVWRRRIPRLASEVEAHESDLSVASELTQVRVAIALKSDAETMKTSWISLFYRNYPREDNPVTADANKSK
jgi:hypothetical protein